MCKVVHLPGFVALLPSVSYHLHAVWKKQPQQVSMKWVGSPIEGAD